MNKEITGGKELLTQNLAYAVKHVLNLRKHSVLQLIKAFEGRKLACGNSGFEFRHKLFPLLKLYSIALKKLQRAEKAWGLLLPGMTVSTQPICV